MTNSEKVVYLVGKYNELTPMGMALVGFKIIEQLDNEMKDCDKELRSTVMSWLNQ